MWSGLIKLTDILSEVSTLLLSLYPTYSIYGNETTEGFDRPSFFIDLKPSSVSRESVNYSKCNYAVRIIYYQDTPNEVDNLNKIDKIREAFGYNLKVCDRFIRIAGYSFEFIGDKANILQLTVEIEYFETTIKSDQHVIAEKLKLNE